MSHTLHRVADENGRADDFVILVMAASLVNKDDDTPRKYQEYLKIMNRHNPVNLGGMGIGHLYDSTFEEIIERIPQVHPKLPMVHGVFGNREDLIAALKDIKEADLGLSVIVTGLVDQTKTCICESGNKRHSMNYSLGIWGETDKLPDEIVLKISSLCGHAMISFSLIEKKIADIKAGKTTPEKAAKDLAKPCACGIFNAQRAQTLLEEFIGGEE